MTALDQRIKPVGSDGYDRLLHGIEHDGQLVAAAFELGKVFAEPFGGLIEGGLHGGELVFAGRFKAGGQVAVGDAAGEGDYATGDERRCGWRARRQVEWRRRER